MQFTPELVEASMWPNRKRGKKEAPKWKKTHEQFFSQVLGMTWPPLCEHLPNGLLPREAENVMAADSLYPPKEPGWQWMDANHSLEFTFQFEPDKMFSDDHNVNLRSPWSPLVPTFTCNSCIVGRLLDTAGHKTFKALNVLEGFMMQGWGLEDWKELPLASGDIMYSKGLIEKSTPSQKKKTIRNLLRRKRLKQFCNHSVSRTELEKAVDFY